MYSDNISDHIIWGPFLYSILNYLDYQHMGLVICSFTFTCLTITYHFCTDLNDYHDRQLTNLANAHRQEISEMKSTYEGEIDKLKV